MKRHLCTRGSGGLSLPPAACYTWHSERKGAVRRLTSLLASVWSEAFCFSSTLWGKDKHKIHFTSTSQEIKSMDFRLFLVANCLSATAEGTVIKKKNNLGLGNYHVDFWIEEKEIIEAFKSITPLRSILNPSDLTLNLLKTETQTGNMLFWRKHLNGNQEPWF